MHCTNCGGKHLSRTIAPSYEPDMIGVPIRFLNSIIVDTCRDCGEETIEIPDLDSLSPSVAVARALTPHRLSGRDLRFFRSVMDMKSGTFADVMGLAPETVSRWERGEREIGVLAERLIRHEICAILRHRVTGFTFDPITITNMREISDGVLTPLTFTYTVPASKRNKGKVWVWVEDESLDAPPTDHHTSDNGLPSGSPVAHS